MSPFVHLGKHSYCPGRKHVIYIKYPDEGTGTPHELLVDFVEEVALNVWLEVSGRILNRRQQNKDVKCATLSLYILYQIVYVFFRRSPRVGDCGWIC